MVSNLRSLRVVVRGLVPGLLRLPTLIAGWRWRWAVRLIVGLLGSPVIKCGSTLRWPLEYSAGVELLRSVGGEDYCFHGLKSARCYPSTNVTSKSLLELACLFLLCG